jgi:hypothetical protein
MPKRPRANVRFLVRFPRKESLLLGALALALLARPAVAEPQPLPGEMKLLGPNRPGGSSLEGAAGGVHVYDRALSKQQAAAVAAATEPELRIFVLTMGPGDHPFFKFGHNAIVVQAQGQPGTVYNWGTFDFESPTLIADFLRGRLTYWLSTAGAASTVREYQYTNRKVDIQELDLSPEQKRTMALRLTDNTRPEKRNYLYDYFWDNCSTRVRDAVDAATGGRLKAAMQGPAKQSYRHHGLRLTSDLLWEYLGLHFGLGRPTDLSATRWQEGFIPQVLHDQLEEVRLPGEGGDRPLVKQSRVLSPTTRADPPATAPNWMHWFALVGLGIGAALALAGRAGVWRPVPRVLFGVLVGLLGLALGLLGCALVFLWGFTNHRAAHANANLLPCPPFVLALAPLAVGLVRGRMVSAQSAFYVATGAALLALAGLAAKLLPGVSQDNLDFIVLLLPVWVGIAYGARCLGRSGG